MSIKKYEVCKISAKEPCFNLFVGEPKLGKSFAIKSLIYKYVKENHIDCVIVLSPTCKMNNDYSFVPEEYRFTDFSVETVKKIYKHLKDLKEKGVDLRTCLIIDDSLGDLKMNSPIIKKLCSTYRHPDLRLFIVTQYLKLVPTWMRNFCSNVCFFRPRDSNTIEALYKGFFSMKFEKEKDFKEFIHNNLNEKYVFVHYEIESNEIKICKQPKNIPEFTLEF